MDKKVNCTLCGGDVSVEINLRSVEMDYESKTVDVECDTCGTKLEVTYTVSVETEVEVSETPSSEFDCPECDDFMFIDIDEDSGSQNMRCENCGAVLEVNWFDWGRGNDVEVLEKGKVDEEDL
jgi:transcription elongation factor Elf1